MTARFPTAKRGSTYKHRLSFTGTGTIADCVIRMMVKRHSADADEDALVSIDNDELGGISIITATSPYEIEITIADDVMALLPAKTLIAGIQIELPDGTTQELDDLDPDFEVSADIVRAVAT